MKEDNQQQMDELRMIVDHMLRDRPENALREVSDLLDVAIQILERDFIEAYSIVQPYRYMCMKPQAEDIQISLHYAYMRIQKLKEEYSTS